MCTPCHDIAEGQLLLVGDCIHSVGAESTITRIFVAETGGYGCPTLQDAQIFRFPSIVNASTIVQDGISEGSIMTLSIAVNASSLPSFSEEFRHSLGGAGLRSFKVERTDEGSFTLSAGVLLQSDEHHHHILRASTGPFLIESPGGLINLRGGTGVVINSLPADPKLSSAYLSLSLDGSIQVTSGERREGGNRDETKPGIKIASASGGITSQDVHVMCGRAIQGNGGNVVVQGGNSDSANGGNVTIRGGKGAGHVNIQGGGTGSKGSGSVYIGTASVAMAGEAAGNVTIKAGGGGGSQLGNSGDVAISGGGVGGASLHLAGECRTGMDNGGRSCSSGSAKLKSLENFILHSEAGSIALTAANRTTITAKEGVDMDARYGRVQLLARNLSTDTDSITMMAKHEALLSSNKRVTAGVSYDDGHNLIHSSTVELSRNGVVHATTGTWEVEAKKRVMIMTSAGENGLLTSMSQGGKTVAYHGARVLLDEGCASVSASADVNISATTMVSLYSGRRNESTVNVAGGEDPTIQIVAPHVTVQASGVGSFRGNDKPPSGSALAELKLKEGRALLVGTQYSALETSSMQGRIGRVTVHEKNGVSLLSSASPNKEVESHLTLLDGDIKLSATKSVHVESNSNSTQLSINGGGIQGFGARISLESKSDGTVLASAVYVTATAPLVELATLHGKSKFTLNSTIVSAMSSGVLKMIATNSAPRSITSELNLESGSSSTASLSSRTVNITGAESMLLHAGMGGLTIETSSTSKTPTVHPYKRARGISFVLTKEQGVGMGPSFSLAVGAKPSALLHVSNALNISESTIPSGALLALESPLGRAEMFISSNDKHASILHFGSNRRPSSASIVVHDMEQSQVCDSAGTTRPSSIAGETLMSIGPDAGSRIVLSSNGEAGVGKVCDSDKACIPMAGWHIISPESVARSGKPSLLVESSSGLNIIEIQGYNRNPQAAVNIVRLASRRNSNSPGEQYWSIVHQPGSLSFTHTEGRTDSPTETKYDSSNALVRFSATASNGRGSVMIGPPASSTASSNARLAVGGVVLAEEMVLYADTTTMRDIEPVNKKSSIERLLKLRIVHYGWRNEDSSKLGLASGVRQMGILAQEAERVMPEIVWRDAANGGQRAVSVSRLTFFAVSGLQNVAVSVDELKAGQLERDKEVAESRKSQAEAQRRVNHLEERFLENLKRLDKLESEKEAMYVTINSQATEIRVLQNSLENTLEKISSLQTAVEELEKSVRLLVQPSVFDVREDEAYFLKVVEEIENDIRNEALKSGKTIDQANDYLQKMEASTLKSALKRLKHRRDILTTMRKQEGRAK